MVFSTKFKFVNIDLNFVAKAAVDKLANQIHTFLIKTIMSHYFDYCSTANRILRKDPLSILAYYCLPPVFPLSWIHTSKFINIDSEGRALS